eukprot:6147265-Prorocentrum_lima.AAC.1
MTSSLVGSEMCIRDRPSPIYHIPRRGAWLVAAAPADQPHPLRARCFESVSYTHLTLPTICSV